MDLNGTGTLVDISSYVRGEIGVAKTGTRQDQFRDPAPATFGFTLDNYDGRFTPNNASSPYAPNTPTERMAVCWNDGGQLREGAIQSLNPTDDNWNLLEVVCDDMLGAASRNTLGPLAGTMVMATSPYLYWPLNDAAESVQAAETSGNNGPPLLFGSGAGLGTALTFSSVTFGAPGVAATGETQLTLQTVGAATGSVQVIGSLFAIKFSAWAFGFWVTPQSFSTGWQLQFLTGPSGDVYLFSGAIGGSGTVTLQNISAGGSVTSSVLSLGPHYVSVTHAAGASQAAFNVDGVSIGVVSASASASTGIGQIFFGLTTFPDAVSYSHISFTPTLVHEEYAGITTLQNRLAAIDATTPQTTLGTLPSDLSVAPVGVAATNSQSALDAFNDAMRGEQGYMDCTTTGTLTNPVQTIRVRARNRPAAITYSFDAQLELAALPPFIRDATNLIWQETVTGAGSSTIVSDATLTARAGSANGSDTILYLQGVDQQAFGSDRINRGKNVNLRASSIQIDNLTLPTNRSADLLAMKPYDRIEITNIPNTVLGFTTWDGWLLDKDELHKSGDQASDLFTLYLAPVTPDPAIVGTDRYAAGGVISLSSTITSGATTVSLATSVANTVMETVSVPYDVVVDSERMTITACTGATPQVATITRGVGGTTAAAHSSSALLEIFQPKPVGY